MSYKVFTVSDRDIWRRYLERLPEVQRDVYFLPEYYELYERPFIKAECFVFEEDGKIAMYPYLKTCINQVVKFKLDREYYDIEGAYGYNGIAANTTDRAFLNSFVKVFAEICSRENVVAEFTRFNPVLNNHQLSPHMEVTLANNNVIVDLSLTEDDIWTKSYEHCTRKNVNKAERSGLFVKSYRGLEIPDALLDAFLKIYHSTMERNSADESYYFGKSYFNGLKEGLRENSLFFFVFDGEEAVSCELVIAGEKTAYSFLGGTQERYYHMRPNNLLKHKIIKELKKLGFARYCIGGGAAMDDGVFRYKRTFSKDGVVEFFVGKMVHNKEAYNYLCAEWEKHFPEKVAAYRNYFLKYKIRPAWASGEKGEI